MNAVELFGLAQRTDVQIVGLALSTLVLGVIAYRVRKIARSERPDDALSNVAMVIGLGWSSEAVWLITKDMPLGVRIALFCVLEVFLTLSMIRAKRHLKEFGWPGRPGQTVWLVASIMAAVAVFAAASPGEALLRLIIPLALAKVWWDGLVGGRSKPAGQVSSWRWTPRRLLLWLGAIEPGERDVETVHRERLTQTMTRLEFARRHGSEKRRERAARKLARLSLTADDEIVATVRARVDRAMWFEAAPVSVSVSDIVAGPVFQYDRPVGPMPAPLSEPEPITVVDLPVDSVTDSVTDTRPAPAKRQPSSQAKVIAAHNRTPTASDEELAVRLGLTVRTIQRHRPTGSVNGNVPALVGAGEKEQR